MTSPIKTCDFSQCEREARAALKVQAHTAKNGVVIHIYADNRLAPATATGYCHEHISTAVVSVADVIVDLDD